MDNKIDALYGSEPEHPADVRHETADALRAENARLDMRIERCVQVLIVLGEAAGNLRGSDNVMRIRSEILKLVGIALAESEDANDERI